ncbi:flippase [Candidatus Woesearchaeota archaeon]|nr:flippase [Candidatus Woesearchaeota archaeon]
MDSRDDSLKKLGKGAVYVFLGVMFSKFIGYLFKFVTARLGSDQYGILSLGIMVYAVFSITLLFGFDYGITRFTALFLGENSKSKVKGLIKFAFPLVLISSLIGSLIMFLSSEFIAINLFRTEQLILVLKIFAFAVPFDCLRGIFLGVIRGFKNLKYEFYARYLIEGSSRILLMFILVYMGFGIVGASIAYVASVILSLLFSMIFFTKTFSFFKVKAEEVSKFEVFDYSWPLMFNALLGLATVSIDSFMIGYFMNVSSVGIYNAIAPIARLTYIIPFSLSALLVPVLVGLYVQKDENAFASVYKILNRWVFMFNLPLLIFIVFFPKEVLSVLFGAEYTVGSLGLIILSVGFFIMYSFMVSREVLLALKKSKDVFVFSLVGVILNVLLNYFLVPIYGIIGAAVASIISLGVISLLIFGTAFKFTKNKFFQWDYLKILGAGFISILLMKLFGTYYSLYSFWSLLFSGVVFLIIYSGFLFVFRSFKAEDKMMIKDVWGSVKLKLGFK